VTTASKVDQFIADSDRAHQIVHGPRGTLVPTEGGLVPSFATVLGDVETINERMTAIESGQAAGRVVVELWATLNTIVGTANVGASVLLDAGSHIDPISGLSVPNQGEYVWVTPANKWKWIREDGLSSKADKSALAVIAEGDFSDKLRFKFSASTPESGYVYALTDALGNIAFGVRPDGSVWAFGVNEKLLPTGMSFVHTPIDSGYVYAMLDDQGQIALGIKQSGEVYAYGLTERLDQIAPYVKPTRDLWLIGDSLTAGAGSQVTWREQLTTANPDRTVTSYAVGGQTSSHQAVRAGAYYSLMTVAGGVIPESGVVAISAVDITPSTDQGQTRRYGRLGGAYGYFDRAAGGAYSFTRTVAGTAIACPGLTPFIPDTGSLSSNVIIIGVGRNNLSDPSRVIGDIDACVALQRTLGRRFLIITPPNGGVVAAGAVNDRAASSYEGEGATNSAVYTNILAIESHCKRTYGDKVLCSREHSFQFSSGSVDDARDVADKIVPRSLRIDPVHWTSAFHEQIFNWVQAQLNKNGW